MTITVKLFTQKATIVKITTENTVDCSESGSHFLLSLKYSLQCCKFCLLDIPQYKPDRRTCKKILKVWSCISDSQKNLPQKTTGILNVYQSQDKTLRGLQNVVSFQYLLYIKYSNVFLWLLNYCPFVSIMRNQTKPKPLLTPLSPQNSDKN